MTALLIREGDPRQLHGRGARTNATGRYEPQSRVSFDDGWTKLDEEPPPIRTIVQEDATRTIIARNKSPDLSFDRSINPYRGCEHGCVYCFARPTHAYLGLSPGVDFESRLFVKPEAAKLLEAELRAPSYVPRVMAIGTNTDPYQPIERKWRVTRSVLEVLARFRHPVGIVTKSTLIQRDIDILGPMAEQNLARVAVSITTLDRKLARVMEPRAATPEKRLETILALTRAGIPTAVMTAPMIPALNDSELESILAAAAVAGATQAGFVVLRLPLEIKDLFREWLEAHAPAKAKHVMSLVRQMRGGKDYDSNWSARMRGTGPYARLIAERFAIATRRLDLNQTHRSLDVSKFRCPPRLGDQLALAL